MIDQDSGVESFYREVANILQCADNYAPRPYSKKTRWNNRHPGNGRYIGHGLVRMYSPTLIHIQLTTPNVCGIFTTTDSALQAISVARQSVTP